MTVIAPPGLPFGVQGCQIGPQGEKSISSRGSMFNAATITLSILVIIVPFQVNLKPECPRLGIASPVLQDSSTIRDVEVGVRLHKVMVMG
jgi:hypothetical protein